MTNASTTQERNPRAPMALMTCGSGQSMAETVAEHLGIPLLPTRETWFACGEGKIEIEANVRGHDVYIFQSMVGEQDDRSIYDRFIMLLHAVEAAALSDAQYITAVTPYYPGARQDKRKGRTREGISAGLFARMLQSAGADRVVTVEIHNDSIAGMFNPSQAHLENIFLTKQFAPWLAAQGHRRMWSSPLMWATSKTRDSTLRNCPLTLPPYLRNGITRSPIGFTLDLDRRSGRARRPTGRRHYRYRRIRRFGRLRVTRARRSNITVACVHPVFSGPLGNAFAS